MVALSAEAPWSERESDIRGLYSKAEVTHRRGWATHRVVRYPDCYQRKVASFTSFLDHATSQRAEGRREGQCSS